MSLLHPQTWSGRINIDGWTRAAGGDAAVVEPATGEELERVGIADAEDIGRAAAGAAAVQRAWADTPYTERAAVLRRSFAMSTDPGRTVARRGRVAEGCDRVSRAFGVVG